MELSPEEACARCAGVYWVGDAERIASLIGVENARRIYPLERKG